MEVLLIVIIVLFLFFRMIPWLIGRWFKRVQKRYANAAGAGPRADGRPEGSTSWQKASQPKKRVDATEGEYVDYEEIKE